LKFSLKGDIISEFLWAWAEGIYVGFYEICYIKVIHLRSVSQELNVVSLILLGQESIVGNCYSWTVLGSYSGGSEILQVRPDRPWVPFSLLYDRLGISFPKKKRPRLFVGHPPHLQPNHYYCPCVPSITSYGTTFLFNISCINLHNYFFDR